MPMRVWRSAMLMLSGAALLLSGCGDAVETKAPSTAQSDLSGVTLVLGDQAKGLRTVVEAANAFEGIDYKVEWANFQGAAPLFEALRAGAVDLGPAGDTPVLAAATGGTPLRIVAVRHSQSRGIAILVPADSPIHSVADLKGRNVVVSSARGSISQYLLIRALANAGVDEKDVNVGFVLTLLKVVSRSKQDVRAMLKALPKLLLCLSNFSTERCRISLSALVLQSASRSDRLRRDAWNGCHQ